MLLFRCVRINLSTIIVLQLLFSFSVLKAMDADDEGLLGTLRSFFHTSAKSQNFTYNFFLTSDSSEEKKVINILKKNRNYFKKIEIIFNGDKGNNIIFSLKNSQSIESIKLYFFYRQLHFAETDAIKYLIVNCSCLSSLDLRASLNDYLFFELANVFKKESVSLKKLVLLSALSSGERSHLSEKATQILFDSIGSSKNLNVLQLGWHFLSNESLFLSLALQVNTTLVTLALSQCGLGDDGLIDLSRSLKENTTLTEIDFSRNGITDAGADIILDILNSNQKLKHIWLGDSYGMHSNSGSSNSYMPNYFNSISSSKREEIRRILLLRQEFNIESMNSSSSMNSNEEDLKIEDISSSSSSSSAIPESYVHPDDVP